MPWSVAPMGVKSESPISLSCRWAGGGAGGVLLGTPHCGGQRSTELDRISQACSKRASEQKVPRAFFSQEIALVCPRCEAQRNLQPGL